MKLLGYGLAFTVVASIAMAIGLADPGLTVLAILVLWGLLGVTWWRSTSGPNPPKQP